MYNTEICFSKLNRYLLQYYKPVNIFCDYRNYFLGAVEMRARPLDGAGVGEVVVDLWGTAQPSTSSWTLPEVTPKGTIRRYSTHLPIFL